MRDKQIDYFPISKLSTMKKILFVCVINIFTLTLFAQTKHKRKVHKKQTVMNRKDGKRDADNIYYRNSEPK